MIEWYVKTKRLLKNIKSKAQDALPLYQQGGKEASTSINGYMKADLQQLRENWLARYPKDEHLFSDLGRHIGLPIGCSRPSVWKPARDLQAIARTGPGD